MQPEDVETIIRQLQISSGNEPLPDTLVAAMSGDQDITPEVCAMMERLQRERGCLLFTQLLFAVTHQRVPEAEAEARWREILCHKYDMSVKLGRNVGVAVAALDYLSNQRHEIEHPVFISRPSMESIARMALEDPLTRVANRSAVLVRLEDEIHRYERHGTPCSLLLIDIDNFSRINNSRGHDAGDKAVIAFADAIMQSLRTVDLCGRFGGDEFMVLLPDTGAPEAGQVAERILSRVRESGLTCSIGIASCPEHGMQVATILSTADKALYAAKNHGKDQVNIVSPVQGAPL